MKESEKNKEIEDEVMEKERKMRDNEGFSVH